MGCPCPVWPHRRVCRPHSGLALQPSAHTAPARLHGRGGPQRQPQHTKPGTASARSLSHFQSTLLIVSQDPKSLLMADTLVAPCAPSSHSILLLLLLSLLTSRFFSFPSSSFLTPFSFPSFLLVRLLSLLSLYRLFFLLCFSLPPSSTLYLSFLDFLGYQDDEDNVNSLHVCVYKRSFSSVLGCVNTLVFKGVTGVFLVLTIHPYYDVFLATRLLYTQKEG